MLKKRLLASAMASIMAVSTLGVAAIADDATTTAEATTAATVVKTKADLQALLDSYSTKFRQETIYDYATATGVAMLNALEFGDNVIADANAEDADYTAAYLMITEVAKDLVIYSAADLKALVAKCKAVYDTENILNDEIADNIYDVEYFGYFAEDYDYANSLSASESQIITDAYVELNASYTTVLSKKLTTVTKAQFAALDKQINTILTKTNKYESWRRGTTTQDMGGWSATISNIRPSGWMDPVALTWGDLLNVEGASNKDGNWVEFFSIGYWRTEAQSAYDNFANIASTGKTTDTAIVETYTKAKKAADAADAFQADSYSTARKATVDSLIKSYKEKIIAKWGFTSAQSDCVLATTTIEDVINTIIDGTGATYATLFGTADMATTMKLSANAPTFYVTYSDETGAITAVTLTKPTSGKYKTYKKNTTIKLYEFVDMKHAITASEYVEIPADLEAALIAAYDYIDGEYVGYMATLSPETVKTETGAAAEWAVIYRFLKYAIDDNFPADAATYSLEQMYQALQDSYKVDTYESAVFAEELEGVVAIRKLASNFYKEAKKLTNYTTGTGIANVSFTWRGETYVVISEITSTDLYKALIWDTNIGADISFDEGALTLKSVATFAKKLAIYPVSYGEIYDAIGEASEMAEEFSADDTFKGLIEDVAYYLTVCEANPNDAEGTNAWDDARVLQPTNRITAYNSWEGNYYLGHANLLAAYNALVAAMDALENPAVTLGDVNGDKAVNMVDALLVLKYSVGMDVEIVKEAADYTNDGAIDVRDALAIMKAALA